MRLRGLVLFVSLLLASASAQQSVLGGEPVIAVIHADVYGYVATLETSYGDDEVIQMVLCDSAEPRDDRCVELAADGAGTWPDGLRSQMEETWIVARVTVVVTASSYDATVERVWSERQYFGRTIHPHEVATR